MADAITGEERACLRRVRLAVFADRLIADAQPPMSARQQAMIEASFGRALPPGLLDLWRTSFGGRMDYRYVVRLNGELHYPNLRQLWYPGWRAVGPGTVADERDFLNVVGAASRPEANFQRYRKGVRRRAPPARWRGGQTVFAPLGGFELYSTFHVALDRGKGTPRGSVMVSAESRERVEDGRFVTRAGGVVARDVADLFGQLTVPPLKSGEKDRTQTAQALAALRADGPVGDRLFARLAPLWRG